MKSVKTLLLALIMVLSLSLFGCAKAETRITIVVPQSSNSDAAKLVQTAFLEEWGREVDIIEDSKAKQKGIEILLGKTNREQSQKVSEGLRPKDYAITFSKSAIAIAGGSEDSTLEGARHFIDTYMDYYEEQYLLPYDESENYIQQGGYAISSLTIDGVEIHEFSIATLDGEKTDAAVYIQQTLEKATGYSLPIIAATQVADEQPCIILGSSGLRNAPQITAALGEKQYQISSEEQALYLCASEASELIPAKVFITRYLEYDPYTNSAKQKKLSLQSLQGKFTSEIAAGESYQAVLSQVFKLPPEDSFSVFQGGCTDGRYAYYIMNNQTHHPYTNYIYKVDTKTWTVAARSDELTLDHANSLTYNSKLNQLIVSNYEPNFTTITFVDPDTLKITKKTDVGFNALSVCYDENYDRYVFGLEGTYNFVITDANFNVLSYNEGPNFGYIRQEVECDDQFIYFTQSDENHVIIHDWSGKFVTDVELGQYVEVENMIYVDGSWYTGYFSSGGIVYETIIYREIT